jgi:acetyl esterase/lipase
MLRIVALSIVALPLAARAELPPKMSVRALFSNPPASAPELSDDGKTYAFVISKGDLQIVYTRAVDGGDPVPLAKVEDPKTRLAWLEWANDDRLLICVHARNENSVGMRGRVTRLYAVDRNGRNFDWLGKRWPRFGPDQLPVGHQADVVHLTPADPDRILIQYRSPYDWSPEVMSLDVGSGMLKSVQRADHGIYEWYADRDGALRAGEAAQDNAYELWARIDPNQALKLVSTHKQFGEEGPEFAGFHSDPARIYVRQLHDGRDAIFEFDLKTQSLGALVFSHSLVDVAGIERDPGLERQAVGVRFVVDRPDIHFFDAAAAAEHRALRDVFDFEFLRPTFHRAVSASDDGLLRIIEVSSDVQPPVYYLYDRGSHKIGRILEERPDLDPKQLAPTRRVTYRARDGLEIPAYLTLPPGVPPKSLPAIALVHGGPWSRDWIQWDPEVQILANRGFAVLQVNFRGSSGYGEAHLTAGYREWGLKIQDDITDGVKWLIAEGIADPDRIGIAGASYGGYATLVGLVKTPGLFRAGAAYASVTDIEYMISDDKWYDWDYEWHETMVGGERGDRSRLRDNSPLRRAAEITVPVLLGHGEDDQRVHVRQSRRMAEALRAAGKSVEYLEFPDEVHGFLLEVNRIQWYERFVAFFEQHLAPRSPPPEQQ